MRKALTVFFPLWVPTTISNDPADQTKRLLIAAEDFRVTSTGVRRPYSPGYPSRSLGARGLPETSMKGTEAAGPKMEIRSTNGRQWRPRGTAVYTMLMMLRAHEGPRITTLQLTRALGCSTRSRINGEGMKLYRNG